MKGLKRKVAFLVASYVAYKLFRRLCCNVCEDYITGKIGEVYLG